MFSRILLPTDGSELSRKAAREGIALAARMGARITGLTVVPTYRIFTIDSKISRESLDRFEKRNRKAAAAALEFIAKEAARLKVPCKLKQVRSDHPFEEILRESSRGRYRLIVMASHGRRGLSALVLGSETHKVLTHSRIPVMVCR